MNLFNWRIYAFLAIVTLIQSIWCGIEGNIQGFFWVALCILYSI